MKNLYNSEKFGCILDELRDKCLKRIYDSQELESLFNRYGGDQFDCYIKYQFIDKVVIGEKPVVKTGYADAICRNEDKYTVSVRARNPDRQGNKVFAYPKFDIGKVGLYI